MSSQVSDRRGVELDAWINFLRAHAAVTRQFNSELQATHGLTLNDFDVLAQLARVPDGTLKRVELSERVLLTPSGITRLLNGLERAGYVRAGKCETDARVTYAILTDEGREKLRTASKTHLASVRALLSERFEKDELETLAELLARLPMRGDETACDPE
ncbi:MAG: winged helix-turn-helix transcriptional regulator [Actinobacteria bacterium]|nr:MAG: winged helix-turn-helix transcriptional regulator [Actinomycetota bacterium]